MTHLLSPRPAGLRVRRPSLIDVELDPDQRRAVGRPHGGAMLVLGEAGHGKTTVALHRLAHLYKTARGRFRAAVVVPHEGLARLLQPLVTRLGADVRVSTYDAWARRQARRAFGDLPRREAESTPPGARRVKRDPALRALLAELARRPPGRIDDDEDAPPPKTKAHAHRGDLQHLFGDRALVERLARASRQGIGAYAVEQTLEHTRVQFSATGEEAYAHVIDRERLVPADARSLDAGTPAEDAGTVDAEDYAVLFELDRLRGERLGRPPTRPRPYDCLVLDEAQELAPLELALLGRSLAPGGTLVVAGDADQQTDPAACFEGWAATMAELGAPDPERVVLNVGYRCPPAVVALARALREGRRPDRPPPLARFDDGAALVAWVADEARRLERLDEAASLAVVTRSPLLARRLAAGLRGLVPCRLVLDGEFVPHRGVDVTLVEQVKGLEFDAVVIADADAASYPDEPASRRALYVAITRARHSFALACVGAPSPLLAAGGEAPPPAGPAPGAPNAGARTSFYARGAPTLP
ncbi:MAG TPA: ATP-binding domain-containing protein [Polyangiaceae bacterium]|nr:ATP-binding domain-containing protein [Polyangiaceae bacterium]